MNSPSEVSRPLGSTGLRCHPLGFGCYRIADGNVEQNEKWMIESPFHSWRKAGWGTGLVQNVIAVKANDIWLPFDGKDMKRIGESLVVRQ